MEGTRTFVVLDQYGDNSGIVAVYGPFDTKAQADAWPGVPGGPQGSYRVHEMYEPPEWFTDEEISTEDDTDG